MKHVPISEFHRVTGLTQGNFEAVYSFLGGDEVCSRLKYNYKRGTPKRLKIGLTTRDKLLLTLIRLRRGCSIEDLALRFGLSASHVSTIFYVWIQFMHLQFKRIKTEMLPSRQDQKKGMVPPCYKHFKNFRAVLDSTEVQIQIPYHYKQQGNTYSVYKAGNVILYLIGTTAYGSIGFISPGYEGAISDRELFTKSGIQELLQPGDLLLVDKGLTVQDIVDSAKVKVLHPPFLGYRKKLSAEEELLNKMIANVAYMWREQFVN